MELRDLDERFQVRVLQVAELPGLAVGRDRADAGEDMGIAVRGAGPGTGVGCGIGVEVERVCVCGVRGRGLWAFGGNELEEDGLVFAILRGGAGIEADAAVGVPPGARADGEADVGEGVAGEEDGGIGREVVEEGAAGPDGPGGEKGG